MICQLVLVGGFGAALAQDTRPAQSPSAKEVIEDVRQGVHRSAKNLEKDFNRGKVQLLRPGEITSRFDEMTEDMLAAAERIKTNEHTDAAGAHLRRCRFADAESECRKALAKSPTDPYANYLLGLTLIELERYDEAAKAFDAVVAVERESRTSVLLASFCRKVSTSKRPLSDEAIITHLDAAADETIEALKLDKEDEDGTSLADIFSVPQLYMDPLMYKLETEAIEDRGPCAAPLPELIETAGAAGDPLLLYAKLLVPIAEDEEHEVTLTKAQELSARALDVVHEFTSDICYRDPPEELAAEIRALAKEQPEEGMWLLMQIPYAAPTESGSDFEYKPLSDAEQNLLRRAATSTRLTLHRHERETADIKTLTSHKWLYAQRLASGPGGPFAFVRDVVFQRGLATMKALAEKGKPNAAKQLGGEILQIIERLLPLELRKGNLLASLIRSSYVERIELATIEHCAVSATERLKCLSHWRDAQIEKEMIALSTVRELRFDLLPSARLQAAAMRASAEPFENWKIKRAKRIGQKPEIVAKTIESLTLALQRKSRGRFRAKHVFSVGLIRYAEALPELRAATKSEQDDEMLYALMWAAGQYADPELDQWLESLKADKREWVAMFALEMLTRADPATEKKKD
jgi:tetratricopeptide (TPR) repeat protein